MMAATAAPRVKKGGREVSNGARLARRAIWFLLAVGTLLPASVAVARGLTGVSRAASPRQVTTRDRQNTNKPPEVKGSSNNTKGGSRPGPTPRRPNPPAPAPASPDPDIFTNIKLSIAIAGDYDAPPRRINVVLWTRERRKPVTQQTLDSPTQKNNLYTVTLTKGLDINKDYWVTVSSTDTLLSGEAAVPSPVVNNQDMQIRVNLYPAVTFKVSAQRLGEDTFTVVEKNQKSSPIPYTMGQSGKVSFVKGLNREAEYFLVTGDGRRVRVNTEEINDGVLNINLSDGGTSAETVVKVSTDAEGKPIRDAKVSVVFDDSEMFSKVTNERGVAVFQTNGRGVRSVAVEAQGHESFFCDRDSEAACPEPDESGARIITLKDMPPEAVAPLLEWTTIIAFPLMAVTFIVLGFAIFRILLNPTMESAPPYVSTGGAVKNPPTAPKPASGAMTSAHSLQTVETGIQEPNAAFVQHESALTPNAGDAAQPDLSPAAQAYSVPGSLSVEMAKEAYRRWVRREKLTRDPLRLDLAPDSSADAQSIHFRETKDPGSKFILFTDGEDGGWLFPNPAPSVFQTEVEQTWRLVFKDLSKEEFGRKKERLNPVGARRAGGTGGRGMWTAEPKPYEFG